MSEQYQWQRDLYLALHGGFAEEDGLFVWHPPVAVVGRMEWGSIVHVAAPNNLAKAICCLALLVAGCRPASPPPPDLRPWIAVTGVYALMAPAIAPLPPAPAPGAPCENCRGTGKVGDGTVFETCSVCGGTGVTPSKAPAAPLPPVPTAGVSVDPPARSAAPGASGSLTRGLPVSTEEAPTFRIVCEDGVCRKIRVLPR
jgi:hypothetical protein